MNMGGLFDKALGITAEKAGALGDLNKPRGLCQAGFWPGSEADEVGLAKEGRKLAPEALAGELGDGQTGKLRRRQGGGLGEEPPRKIAPE